MRVAAADVVALTTVRMVRTDIDLERRETYRILAEVERADVGTTCVEVMLVVRTGDAGYDTVEENRERILAASSSSSSSTEEEREGPIRARWHMSPATSQVAERVLARLRRRAVSEDEEGRRVIVREN